MSDLYLVLRNRLDAVPEWVFIDAEILKAARERKGLSYETMARTIPVSAKTWERYEKKGRIPRPNLPRVAEVLDLEIEEPARQRVTVRLEKTNVGEDERFDRLEQLMIALDRKIDVEVVPRLDRLAEERRERERSSA
jgi:predicted transcriptional regulator